MSVAVNRKLVVVRDAGSLPELGGISGPLSTPTKITMTAIRKMITNGRTVFECDPADPRNKDKMIRLDLVNVNEIHFGKEQSEPDKKVEEPAPMSDWKEETQSKPKKELISDSEIDNLLSALSADELDPIPEEIPTSDTDTVVPEVEAEAKPDEVGAEEFLQESVTESVPVEQSVEPVKEEVPATAPVQNQNQNNHHNKDKSKNKHK